MAVRGPFPNQNIHNRFFSSVKPNQIIPDGCESWGLSQMKAVWLFQCLCQRAYVRRVPIDSATRTWNGNEEHVGCHCHFSNWKIVLNLQFLMISWFGRWNSMIFHDLPWSSFRNAVMFVAKNARLGGVWFPEKSLPADPDAYAGGHGIAMVSFWRCLKIHPLQNPPWMNVSCGIWNPTKSTKLLEQWGYCIRTRFFLLRVIRNSHTKSGGSQNWWPISTQTAQKHGSQPQHLSMRVIPAIWFIP